MFKKNFSDICAKKGLSPTSVCVAVGLSNAIYSRWTDESVPHETTRIKLANYLGVSVEDLFREDAPAPEEEKSPAAGLNQQLAELWEQLDEAGQEEAMRYLEYLRSRRKG